MPYTQDILYRLWNDVTGEIIEAGEDADGVKLVEVRNKDSNGNVAQTLVMTQEQAQWLADTLPLVLANLKFSVRINQ